MIGVFRLRLRHVLRLALVALPLGAVARGEVAVIRATREQHERFKEGSRDAAVEIDALIGHIGDVLPPHGYVGYLDPGFGSGPKSTRQFFLTQYALAPRVLVRNTEPTHLIYFSHRGEPLTADNIPAGMRVVLQVRPDLAVLARR